ncbi:MAG: hypothetical protein GY874_05420 [Desulfobacteraceae bacterium]|nr:hypothetical protein [Desulfobacteraceae bacterium]
MYRASSAPPPPPTGAGPPVRLGDEKIEFSKSEGAIPTDYRPKNNMAGMSNVSSLPSDSNPPPKAKNKSAQVLGPGEVHLKKMAHIIELDMTDKSSIQEVLKEYLVKHPDLIDGKNPPANLTLKLKNLKDAKEEIDIGEQITLENDVKYTVSEMSIIDKEGKPCDIKFNPNATWTVKKDDKEELVKKFPKIHKLIKNSQTSNITYYRSGRIEDDKKTIAESELPKWKKFTNKFKSKSPETSPDENGSEKVEDSQDPATDNKNNTAATGNTSGTAATGNTSVTPGNIPVTTTVPGPTNKGNPTQKVQNPTEVKNNNGKKGANNSQNSSKTAATGQTGTGNPPQEVQDPTAKKEGDYDHEKTYEQNPKVEEILGLGPYNLKK